MDWRDRFWSKVDRSGECWLWTDTPHSRGYGRFFVKELGSRAEYAHRLAWELTRGAVPAGMRIRHRCNELGCVRPEHLFLAAGSRSRAPAIDVGLGLDAE